LRNIYIKVFKSDGTWFNKNIIDATYEERLVWYYRQSKGQIVNVLEQFIEMDQKDILKK